MRNKIKTSLLSAMLLAATTPFAAGIAAPITYDVDQTIGSGHVIGTIGTDGTLGIISASNIVDWTLTLMSGADTFILNQVNSVVVVSGLDLTATKSNLLFNYSATDYGNLLFQDGLYSGTHYYCAQATGPSVCAQGASVTPQSISDPSFQHVGLAGNLVIGTTVSTVPLPSALPLLGAALLTLAGFRRLVGRRHLVAAPDAR